MDENSFFSPGEPVTTPETSRKRYMALVKASFVAMGVDTFLILLKFFLAGLASSEVIRADAWHSIADFGVSFIVLISILVHYGLKGNFWARMAERLVALLIGAVLIFGGGRMAYDTIVYSQYITYDLSAGLPLVIAFAGVSIACIVSFAAACYKRGIGKKWSSMVFSAEGMHTLSDFFTSLGVWATLLLGYFGINIEKWMTLIVALVVLKIGFEVFFRALYTEFTKKALKKLGGIIAIIIPGSFQESVAGFWKKSSGLVKGIVSPVFTFFSTREQWLVQHYRTVVGSVAALVFILYLGIGFYSVLPCQTGVELLFGKVTEQNDAGLHYHAPTPFGKVVLVETRIASRVESGFRTDWEFEGEEPVAYLWEFTHVKGRYNKVSEEAISISGDENLMDSNFLCYYRITDPVQYALSCNNAQEILRSLFCHEVHSVIGQYSIDSLLSSCRGKVQHELTLRMKESVRGLHLGVDIQRVCMQEAHPPIEVVPQYRAVASARERKDEIIHNAHAYANDLLPRSQGKAEKHLLDSNAYAIEKSLAARGDAEAFNLKQGNYNRAEQVHRKRLWWETVEKAMRYKPVFILPQNAGRRVFTEENKLGVTEQ